MAEQSLEISDERRGAGRECLRLLDEYGLGVQGAVWLYIDGLKEWRYYIVTSLIDIDGLVETFNRIEKIFGLKFNNDHLSIDDVHIGSPNEPLFTTLSKAFKVTTGGFLELNNVAVEGQYGRLLIVRALIYQLDAAPAPIKAKQARQQFDRNVKELERVAHAG